MARPSLSQRRSAGITFRITLCLPSFGWCTKEPSDNNPCPWDYSTRCPCCCLQLVSLSLHPSRFSSSTTPCLGMPFLATLIVAGCSLVPPPCWGPTLHLCGYRPFSPIFWTLPLFSVSINVTPSRYVCTCVCVHACIAVCGLCGLGERASAVQCRQSRLAVGQSHAVLGSSETSGTDCPGGTAININGPQDVDSHDSASCPFPVLQRAGARRSSTTAGGVGQPQAQTHTHTHFSPSLRGTNHPFWASWGSSE